MQTSIWRGDIRGGPTTHGVDCVDLSDSTKWILYPWYGRDWLDSGETVLGVCLRPGRQSLRYALKQFERWSELSCIGKFTYRDSAQVLYTERGLLLENWKKRCYLFVIVTWWW